MAIWKQQWKCCGKRIDVFQITGSVTTVPSPIYLRSRFRNNSVIISSIMTLLNLRSHLTAPVSDSVLPTCSTSFVSQNAHAPSRPKPLPSSYKSSHVFTGFLSFEIEHDPLLSSKSLSTLIPVLLSIYPCSLFTGARPLRLVSLDLCPRQYSRVCRCVNNATCPLLSEA